MNTMKFIKQFILFFIGGITYLMIEIIFRGYTHQSMFFVGGVCFLLIGLLNEKFSGEMAMITQMFLSSIIVTTVEFVSGCIINLILDLNVWDYSHVSGNVIGQIALPFTLAWFLLSGIGILFDDFLKHFIFSKSMPKHRII